MNNTAKTAIMITLYLVAIIAANILVAIFGAGISVLNAFLFIGLDITARDSLHEAWRNEGLWWKMMLLIATGSILSAALTFVFSPAIAEITTRIAAASFISFAVAGLADALVYHVLRDRVRLLKINGSNVVSAAVDSALFLPLAFGPPFPVLAMLGQFVAKVAGGFIWSLILRFFDQEPSVSQPA